MVPYCHDCNKSEKVTKFFSINWWCHLCCSIRYFRKCDQLKHCFWFHANRINILSSACPGRVKWLKKNNLSATCTTEPLFLLKVKHILRNFYLCPPRYSVTSGIFTAPIAGQYYFDQYWTMTNAHPQNIYIIKDGAIQCATVGDSYGGSDFNAPSCSAIMNLDAQDQVWVASGHNNKEVGCASCTGFIGFLVRAFV